MIFSKKGEKIHYLNAENLILVTNNAREFSRISHLKIENWV